MKKFLLLFIGFTVALQAYTYNNALMKIYAKIAPRMVLMTQDSQHSTDKKIHICILYEKGDEASAKSLRDAMQSIYPDGLNERPLSFTLAPYSHYSSCKNASLLFLLDTDSETMKPGLEFAAKHRILTMSYSSRFLNEGVILSLHLGKTVRPYLNMEAAVKNGITPNNLLIRISKIYSKGGE